MNQTLELVHINASDTDDYITEYSDTPCNIYLTEVGENGTGKYLTAWIFRLIFKKLFFETFQS